MSWRRILASIAGILIAATGKAAQPPGWLRINFPDDSPVIVFSAFWGPSTWVIRGSGAMLNLQASLALLNSGQRHIRGISLLVFAGDVAGGKGLAMPPGLNIAPGDLFPIDLNLRLLRPAQAADSTPVEVRLDGVLFDDLQFYGPNKLSSRRLLTAREIEAQHDRRSFEMLLERGGIEALRNEILGFLGHPPERPTASSRSVRGRSTAYEPESELQQTHSSTPEGERLLEVYRKNGMKALLDELSRF